MSEAQYKSKRQIREARLLIVAEVYFGKGLSIRKTATEIAKRLGTKEPSTRTILLDVEFLRAEHAKTTMESVAEGIERECQKCEYAIEQLYEAWEKSKQNHTIEQSKKKGMVLPGKKVVDRKGELVNGPGKIETYATEKTERTEVNYGDVRIMGEILKQQQEYRKLKGHYAAEKRDIRIDAGQFEGFDAFMEACRDVKLSDDE